MIEEELFNRADMYVRCRYTLDINYGTWLKAMASKLKVPVSYLIEYIEQKEEENA